MTQDPGVPDIEAEGRRLVGSPLDPDALTTVVDGVDRLGTWELRDGPHPLPQDPDEVRHELILRHGRHGGGVSSGTAPRIQPGQIASMGSEAHGHRDPELGWISIGYLLARCEPTVAGVRVQFDDGVISELSTVLSRTTGVRWAVCPLDTVSIASRIVFLDEAGSVLGAHDIRDPRTRPRPK